MDLISTPASVRSELSQKFDMLPIFKRDRATALYHFSAALEMNTYPYTVDLDLLMAQGRRVLEASMRAIPGIYRNCPAAPLASTVRFNPVAFAEAMELVEFAFRYQQVTYCFELADRGQFDVRDDPLEQRTIFTYVSQDESAKILSCAATKETRTSSELLKRTTPSSWSLRGRHGRSWEKTINFVEPDAISYRLTPALLGIAKRWAEALA